MRRIVITGNTGSGKTTLARDLSHKLGVPHVELDALHWGPNWTPAEIFVFRERTSTALSGEAWVADGNYSKLRDIVWTRADTLVWLDFPLTLVLWRLLRRTIRRIVSRELLWGTNRESFRGAFLSRDSLLIWAGTSYRRHRREYPLLVQQPHYAHLKLVRLTSPTAVRRWLETI